MYNKLILLLVSLSLLANVSCAQTSPPSQVDKLTTGSQVQQFVRARKAGHKLFMLADSLHHECDSLLNRMALGRQPNWQKADFDGNGLTDLLVSGYDDAYRQGRGNLCFLDVGKQKFQEVQLNYGDYYGILLRLSRTGKGAGICCIHPVNTKNKKGERISPVWRIDTLIWETSRFVEYNPAPKDYRIQHVAFSTTACFGTCPVFDLEIDKDGPAIYHAREYSKKLGHFTASIDEAALRELWDLLNYLDFIELDNLYEVPFTDAPTCTLTITYAGGKVKTIEDYGEEGTLGLQRVYELLFALRTTQHWR